LLLKNTKRKVDLGIVHCMKEGKRHRKNIY
jgi:hypothetical protein